MSQTITAIYEDGVLKPTEPLDLKEHEEVSVTITPVPLHSLSPEERVRRLKEFWATRRPIFAPIPRPTRDELYDRG